MNWDGDERRTNGKKDHDLLIKIDSNLTNFIHNFDNHIKADEESFKSQDGRIKSLEKAYWMGVGIIVIVEFVTRFIK